MIDSGSFVNGMLRIATATGRSADDAAFEFYHEALQHETDAVEWDAFTRHCFRAGRFQWFPKAHELLDALREFRGVPSLDTEATVAYERVLESGDYNPESGTTWTFRGVREKCGPAAAEAFLAAGGHSAFVTTWEEAQRRERFVQAYQQTARAEPAGRLIGSGQAQIEEGRQ